MLSTLQSQHTRGLMVTHSHTPVWSEVIFTANNWPVGQKLNNYGIFSACWLRVSDTTVSGVVCYSLGCREGWVFFFYHPHRAALATVLVTKIPECEMTHFSKYIYISISRPSANVSFTSSQLLCISLKCPRWCSFDMHTRYRARAVPADDDDEVMRNNLRCQLTYYYYSIRDKLWPMPKHGSVTSTETRRLVMTDSPGRPHRLSHSYWTMRYQQRHTRGIKNTDITKQDS